MDLHHTPKSCSPSCPETEYLAALISDKARLGLKGEGALCIPTWLSLTRRVVANHDPRRATAESEIYLAAPFPANTPNSARRNKKLCDKQPEMFALAKAARAACIRPVLKRNLAEIANVPSKVQETVLPDVPTRGGLPIKGRIPVREDHGLYAFFRRKAGEDLVGDARFEVVETPNEMQAVTGRAWRASELRLKSFRDLHTLWYILLRERNLLATQKEEARRMGVSSTQLQVSAVRVHQCRKSMARIKAVLNERRLAYEGVIKILQQQREEKIEKEVLEHQKRVYEEEGQFAHAHAQFAESDTTRQTTQPTLDGPSPVFTQGTPASTETVRREDVGAAESDSKKTDVELESKHPELVRPTPTKPVDAVAAGLFGEEITAEKSRRS